MRVPAHGAIIGAEEDAALIEVVRRRWYTEGLACAEFSRKLRKFTNSRDVILVNSGSSANLIAVTTLAQPEHGDRAIKRGDEVITTALAFPTTINPIIQIGAVPVFVDVRIPELVPTTADVEAAISPKTKAIVLTHTLGYPLPMRELREIANRYNLWLVEDCCDAIGSPGTFEYSDLATLSFFTAHQVAAGEGGAVLTNNLRLGKIARSLRDWGRDCWCEPGHDNTCGKRFAGAYDHKYTFSRIGYNLKMTEFQAAIGSAQMDRLDRFVNLRCSNHAKLNTLMARAGMDEFFILPPNNSASWFGYCLICKPPVYRKDIVNYLESQLIQTRHVFGGNILRQPGYKTIKRRIVGIENTNTIHDFAFWVGCWPGLEEAQLEHIVNSIVEYTRRIND